MEFGGYLTIERGDNEYYSEKCYKELIRFNAARYAIVYAVKVGGYKRVWLPYYLCRSVYDTLLRYDVECVFYSLNADLEPVHGKLDKDEVIVIVNYYGIKGEDYYKKCCKKYSNIIFDNTQAFFMKPIIEENIYNIYSPRKFVGVADGAYLISKCVDLSRNSWYEDIETDSSTKRSRFIFEAVEEGTNMHYLDYLEAEKELERSTVRFMSPLTRHILSAIDYEQVKFRRKVNFKLAGDNLCEKNKLRFEDLDVVPMVYPFLVEKGSFIRKELVRKKVYIPQWWKWILEDERIKYKINDIEVELADNLVPIPIDQRYGKSEMEELLGVVKEEMSKQ